MRQYRTVPEPNPMVDQYNTNPVAKFHDMEYSLSGLGQTNGYANEVVKPSSDDASLKYRNWVVIRPAVKPLSVTDIYPTHGQFADWEQNKFTTRDNTQIPNTRSQIPEYMFNAPVGRKS